MILHHDLPIPRLTEESLQAWREIPPAVASDAQNRLQAMRSAIRPLHLDMRLAAQARTVQCKIGDNGALHAALTIVEPGDVLVCDAGGYEDTALFGGLMARAAQARGVAGLVIDGAIRDRAEIIEMNLPVFARSAVPRGPHKGLGGAIDGPISCGGLTVHPGDLILGDADGVTVVPFAQAGPVFDAAQAILAKEAKALATLAEGGSLADLYGVPEITKLPR
ncbi:MAG: RraA family protein [Pseudomonadota bacterium]